MSTLSHILPFLQFRQSTEWSCGTAALQMVLAYYGIDEREERLRKQAGTTQQWGTSITSMLRVLHAHQLRVIACPMSINDVKQHILKGRPVILLLQAWTLKKNVDWRNNWNDGHYAVAIGYDKRRMIFADPASIYRTTLTYKELEQRWHDMDKNKIRYDHIGIVVHGKKPQYRHDTIIHMD